MIASGTPIQNNLDELFAVVQFAAPGFLGSLKEFQTLYADPINNGRVSAPDSQVARLAEQAAADLRSKLSRILLRRTRDTVLKAILPPRSVRVLMCTMSSRQRSLYTAECAGILSEFSEDMTREDLDARLIAEEYEAGGGAEDAPTVSEAPRPDGKQIKAPPSVGLKRERDSDGGGSTGGDLILAKLLSLRLICSSPTPADLVSREEVSALTRETKVELLLASSAKIKVRKTTLVFFSKALNTSF